MRRIVLLVAGLLLAAACRGGAPPPAKDAVQDAFREDGLLGVEAHGHRLFVERCATCHGPQGRGDGQNAFNLDPPPPDFQQSLAKLSAADRRQVIVNGTASLGRSPLCPPSGRALEADEIDALLAWLDVAARPGPPDVSERGRHPPR